MTASSPLEEIRARAARRPRSERGQTDVDVLLSEIDRLAERVKELERIDPTKLREIAEWFDTVDELLDVCFTKESVEGAILLAGSGDLAPLRNRLQGPRDQIQRDLLGWASILPAHQEEPGGGCGLCGPASVAGM